MVYIISHQVRRNLMNSKHVHTLDSILVGFSQAISNSSLTPKPNPTETLPRVQSFISSHFRDQELKLCRSIQSGEEGAFLLLIDRYHAPLLEFAHLLVSEKRRAQKLVNDTWGAILDSIDQFQGEIPIKIWMFDILLEQLENDKLNQSQDTLMPEVFESSLSMELPNHEIQPVSTTNSKGLANNKKDSTTDSLQHKGLQSGAILEALKHALYQLPEQQRQVVFLRDVEGLSAEEVQHLVHVPEIRQTILLQQGRETLRKVLDSALEQQARLVPQHVCGSHKHTLS